MDLHVKAIRSEVSFDEDGDITNVLILEESVTGEQFLAVVSDDVVRRLVEIRQGLPAQTTLPVQPPPMLDPVAESWEPEDPYGLADQGAVVFGGAAAEPRTELEEAYAPTVPPPAPEPLPVQAKTVEQQLREMKTKKVDINAKYNGGPTVAKDDLGYPIVPKLQRAPVVRDGDEDGISQA